MRDGMVGRVDKHDYEKPFNGNWRKLKLRQQLTAEISSRSVITKRRK